MLINCWEQKSRRNWFTRTILHFLALYKKLQEATRILSDDVRCLRTSPNKGFNIIPAIQSFIWLGINWFDLIGKTAKLKKNKIKRSMTNLWCVWILRDKLPRAFKLSRLSIHGRVLIKKCQSKSRNEDEHRHRNLRATKGFWSFYNLSRAIEVVLSVTSFEKPLFVRITFCLIRINF